MTRIKREKQEPVKALNEDQMRAAVMKKVFGDANDSDQSFEDIEPSLKTTMNVGATCSTLVRKVGRHLLNMRLKNYKEDENGSIRNGYGGLALSPAWELTWHDGRINPNFLRKMLPF